MDPKLLSAIGAAGAAGDSVIGVEDVFSTDVWIGTDSARTITTGVDLTDGGMMWFFNRDSSSNVPNLVDTESGINKHLKLGSPGSAAQATSTSRVTAVSSTGYSIGGDSDLNAGSNGCVGWTFKKQKKFFTCLTYSGTGSATTVSHDLGSVPGAIFVKRTDSQSNWYVYHRGIGATKNLQLNSNAGESTNTDRWNDTAPTASVFSLGDQSEVNASGGAYVAYLFAHEEAAFGPNSDQKIISCGSYTGSGSSMSHDIGFEPQFLIAKRTNGADHWCIFDSMRGIVTGGIDPHLQANTNSVEGDSNMLELTPTGFITHQSNIHYNGDSYIYIAIAAETGKTMKAIETASDVFAIDTGASSSTIPNYDSGFAVDFALLSATTSSSDPMWFAASRLMGTKYVRTDKNLAEATYTAGLKWDSNIGWAADGGDSNHHSWQWKRNAGFDVVAYDGTGSARTQNHNLGVIPEMLWVKERGGNESWRVYHKGLNGGTNPHEYNLMLNETAAESDATWVWNDTAPTATAFSVASDASTNGQSDKYIAMLFASVKGVSHCGYYDGSDSSQTITIPDGGFQPRFIIIKCTTHAFDWLVFDTTRGWTSGNDQRIRLNTDEAQAAQDVGAPTSTGFTLTSEWDWNDAGKKYIYYAHA